MFAVLFIVVTYAVNMVGLVSPLVWVLTVPVSVAACGIVFMLFLTRVKRFGLVTLFAVSLSLFYLITGNTLVSTVGIVLLGLGADLVARAGRYRSKWAAVGAYTFFGVSFLTPFLPIVIDREGHFASSTWEQMGADYTEAADRLLTLPVLGALAAATIVAGFLGALLGAAVLRKHFEKAGLA
jgi:energy-coupling factor transport system substrate-specific component